MTLKEKREMLESLGKDATLYIDMDGVLAKWEEGCTYERTLAPRYFYYLELEEAAKVAVLLLAEAGFKVCVLSAAYEDGTAREDKALWLEKHGLGNINRLFVPCGVPKSDFINVEPGKYYFLLDDYNFNLTTWTDTKKNDGKFIAIKFLNGINGGGNVWSGRTIYHFSDGETIANTLADFMVMA